MIVLMGAPGAGKSTWAEANQGAAVLCSTEPLRLERQRFDEAGRTAYLRSLITRAARALAAGQSVIIDACNTRRQHRARWQRLGREHGARTRLVAVHAPLAALLDVQTSREQPVDAALVRSYQTEFTVALLVVHREEWDEVIHVGRERIVEGDTAADDAHHWVSEDQP